MYRVVKKSFLNSFLNSAHESEILEHLSSSYEKLAKEPFCNNCSLKIIFLRFSISAKSIYKEEFFGCAVRKTFLFIFFLLLFVPFLSEILKNYGYI